MRTRPGTGAVGTAGLGWALALAGGLAAQEPRAPERGQEPPPAAGDTAAPPGAVAPEDRPHREGCRLRLDSKPSTTLERVRRGGSYVHHIGGGMVWRCGNAQMEADSAVRYEAVRRVEMIGSIDYRDTIRTLRSDFLTYYELPDLVVATGRVLLTRLGTGSTLEGPRVEFLRAVSGREELTVASGRPHLTLYPTGEGESPPFEVDADVTELAGEEMARARGDVVIRRPDLTARADSAVFDIVQGGGVLHGAPSVEARGIRLAGDTIRMAFAGEELREVWARGRAFAKGDTYEVAAEEIRARLEGEVAREVWAFGPGRSAAESGRHRVYGDSLRFSLSEGRVDTVVAIGGAAAEERPGEAPASAEGEGAASGALRGPSGELDEPALRFEGTPSWMAGDTLYAVFEPVPPETSQTTEGAGGAAEADADAAPAAEGDEAAPDATPPPAEGRRLARIRIVGVGEPARAYYTTVPDSARSGALARHYMLGEEIEILFEGGEASHVRGRRAIGLHLDPEEGEGAEPPPSAGGGAASGDGGR